MMDALRSATTLDVWREVLDDPSSPKNVALDLRMETAESHYFMARSALTKDAGLDHGLAHLAELLAIDPGETEWLSMLDAYRERLGDLAAHLGPVNGKPCSANEAIRAHEMAERGELDAAIDLLVRVTKAKPSADYLDAWALPWIEARPDRVADDTLLDVLSTAATTLPEWESLPARRQDVASRWARIAITEAARLFRSGAKPRVADMFLPGLCRKAGLWDEGLALADTAARPRWGTWVARGLLLRRMSRTDEARAPFDEAITLEPTNVAAYLEAGDNLFDVERWAEARAYYERALVKVAENAWATTSITFCAWREGGRTGSPPGLDVRDARGRELLDRELPFVGYVREPTDALANALRRMGPRLEREREATVALSDVEAPSNLVLASTLGIRARVTYQHVATPDPREPVANVRFALFRREGEVLVVDAPPPPAALQAAIATLAARPFRRTRAWAEASRFARQLKPEDAASVLACAVHPPPEPEGLTPFAWIPRVQLASAFVAAQIATHEPWFESVRRDALLSLLHGPMDWTTETAVVALVLAMHDEPIIAVDVHRAFAKLLHARPNGGGCPWEAQLVFEWLALPGLFPDEREDLRARLGRLSRP